MRHQRHYTIAEARARRAWVRNRVRAARAALAALAGPEARAAVAALDPQGGGGWPGRAVAEATLIVQRALTELDAADIVVRDVERGLVDFPALRDGREVYLCWEEGEDDVSHWHEVDAGFSGRQDL